MHIKRCPDPQCDRPFQVNQFSVTVATLMAPGKIICPHCGLTMEGESDSVFLTHALSLEQETQFNTQHPRDQQAA